MDITYLGHSAFKLKATNASVVTDPFDKYIGFAMPSVSADIVTVSHEHKDHSDISSVKGTSRRPEPFVVSAPGEYEVGGVSIFGIRTYHDNKQGEDRGKNTAYVIHLGGVKIAHLGDLGHQLSDKQLEELDGVDVLLCPVGGHYTISAKDAVKMVSAVQPSFIVPMHYLTDKHDQKTFGKVAPLKEFLTEMGAGEVQAVDKLTVSPTSLPEETEVVVLE